MKDLLPVIGASSHNLGKTSFDIAEMLRLSVATLVRNN